MALQLYWGPLAFRMQFAAAVPAYSDEEATRSIGASVLARWETGRVPPALGALFGLILVSVAFARGGQSDLNPLIVSGFGREWFTGAVVPKFALSASWAMILGTLMFTGSAGLWRLWQMFIQLAEQDTVDIPIYVLPRVRHVVLLGEFVGAAWAADVLLAYTATFNRAGVLSFSFVVAATIVGFATLLLPHLSIHLSLRRMEHRLGAQVARRAQEALDSKPSPIDTLRILGHILSDSPKTWPYDLGFVLPFVLGQVATAGVGLLGVR